MFSLLGFTLAWSWLRAIMNAPTNAPPSAKIIFVFLNLISISLSNFSVADFVLAAKAAKIPQGLRELQLTQLYPQDELCPSEEQNLFLLQIFGQVYL